MTDFPKLTLQRSIYAFVTICISVVVIAVSVFVYLRGDRLLDSLLDSATSFRAEVIAQNLGRSLYEDWHELEYLAERLEAEDPESLQGYMDGMRSSAGRVAWVGFTDISGIVVAASADLLKGADVSERPLFRGGLQGGFAGDVQNATLLTKALGMSPDNPLEVIGLSRPVYDINGEIKGVVAAVINAEWLLNQLAENALLMDMDIYLIGSGGKVSASSEQDIDGLDALKIFQDARAGLLSSSREVWPDGVTYFSTVVPEISYETLPNFGWRMVGRLDHSMLQVSQKSIAQGLAIAIAAAVLLIFAITAFYYTLFIRPIRTLSDSAFDIARGDKLPLRLGTTREASRISSALIQMQSSLRHD